MIACLARLTSAPQEALKKRIPRRLAAVLTQNVSSGKRVMDVFRGWDVDGDGQITKAELTAGLARLKLAFDPADIETLFADWDPDGSGTLSHRELNTVLKAAKEEQDAADTEALFRPEKEQELTGDPLPVFEQKAIPLESLLDESLLQFDLKPAFDLDTQFDDHLDVIRMGDNQARAEAGLEALPPTPRTLLRVCTAFHETHAATCRTQRRRRVHCFLAKCLCALHLRRLSMRLQEMR